MDDCPNPSEGWMQIELVSQPKPFGVEIINSQGRRVLFHKNYAGEKLDLSALCSGLYLISAYGTSGLLGIQKLLLNP